MFTSSIVIGNGIHKTNEMNTIMFILVWLTNNYLYIRDICSCFPEIRLGNTTTYVVIMSHIEYHLGSECGISSGLQRERINGLFIKYEHQ